MRRMHWLVLCAICLVARGATTNSRSFPPCRCVRFTTDCSSRQKTRVQTSEICPRATKLDLSNNNFRDIPAGLSVNVTEIDLSRNSISSSNNALRELSKLRVLNVKVNSLPSLEFLPENCGLRNLDVSVNDIIDVNSGLQRCTLLEVLDLSFNRIDSLSEGKFSNLSRLRSLDLSGNALSTVPAGAFDGLLQLDSLHLRTCQLSALSEDAFRGPGVLRQLHLESNVLQTLVPRAFAPLGHLQKLNLAGNGLQQVPPGLFAPLARLEELHLERNDLRQLPVSALTGLNAMTALWMQRSGLWMLPELRDCCTALRIADFRENNITQPSEAALRSLLRGSLEKAELQGNPLEARALQWTLAAEDLRIQNDDRDCQCGKISSKAKTTGYVHLCFNVTCNPRNDFRELVAATNAA